MKGKLIVIDGGDGSGKATQTMLLSDRLKNEGYDVIMLDFPQYGKSSAYFVEQYLNGKYGKADDVSAKTASMFYALDRFDSKNKLLNSLKSGKIIISNRYVSSNAGHQGGKIKDSKKREEFLDWLNELEFGILGLPEPDLNIYLYVPWKIGKKLVDKKEYRNYINGGKRDIHEADNNHLKNTEESYMHLAKNKKNWETINCMKNLELSSKKEVHELVYKQVKNLL